MKADLIQISLDETDEPVLKFSVSDNERTLEQRLLGALIRKIARHGIELHLVRTYPDSEEKVHYEYQIRTIRHETNP